MRATQLTRTLAVAIALCGTLASPARAAEPAHSINSWYMKNVSTFAHDDLGCRQGNAIDNQAGSQEYEQMLFYGAPVFNFDLNRYSVTIWTDPARAAATLLQVQNAVQAYLAGYVRCLADRASFLYVGVGTSNDELNKTTEYTTFGHGQAWAQMVQNLTKWVGDNNYGGLIGIRGALDAELDWNDPGDTRNWVDGFASATTGLLINFGDAAGCPYDGPVDSTNMGRCGGFDFPSWTGEDVVYVSWAASPSVPFTQIYRNPETGYPNGVQARAWQMLSKFSHNRGTNAMQFHGGLSQYSACIQPGHGCRAESDNTPSQSFNYLQNDINREAATAGAPDFKSDMRFCDLTSLGKCA